MIFLTISDIANCFGVAIKTVHRWGKKGFPKPYPTEYKNKLWFICDILEWAEKQKNKKLYFYGITLEKYDYKNFSDAFKNYQKQFMKKRFNKKSGDKVFYFSNHALGLIGRKPFVRAYREYRKNLNNLKESQ